MKKEKHAHGPEQKKEIITRLKRIEGQIRGLARMVENDDYCLEILNQFASVKSALNGTRDLLLKEHIQHCIAEKMLTDRQAATEELIVIVKRMTKS